MVGFYIWTFLYKEEICIRANGWKGKKLLEDGQLYLPRVTANLSMLFFFDSRTWKIKETHWILIGNILYPQ